ncbi:MAG: single-stranded DNA-binding protein [Anaerococcus sp.]|jgi:single-strand DNA-binding protein|nr:single-stranded DNA-binding protein [Peptoniphilaceae bacterium]MDY3055339.1 single-stranded DNA-binding protein [Anaerococcus sp.]
MNRVVLVGRLTRDPELRYTQSRTAVCSFSLAVDRGLSKQKRQEAEANNRPTADFPRITVWGVQAENASRYLHKGSQCAVDGRIQTDSYQDAQTGKMIYTTEVVAERVEFLDSRSSGQQNTGFGNMNQDQGYGSMNQDQGYNNSYNNNQANNSYQSNNSDDFFDDDFTEIEDDGRIPF